MIATGRILARVLVAFAIGRAAVAQEPRAFVALDAGARSVFAGEPFVVTLRVGLDPTLRRDQLVPLFQRAADVPVRVTAPRVTADGEPSGGLTRLAPRANASTLGLQDDVVPAEAVGLRIVDGRAFEVFEIRFRAIVDTVGPCSFDAPRLEFASATRFDDDLFQGRVPIDRVESAVEGAVETVQVVAVPLAGRPAVYCGAIGKFTLDVSTPTREVVLGDGFVVTVRLSGEGNLDAACAPDWSPWRELHVRGVLERRDVGVREFDVDVVPTSVEVTAIPALRYASFDPEGGGRYVEVESTALPLRVLPDATGRTTLPGAAPSAVVSTENVEPDSDAPGLDTFWFVVIGIALIVGLAWRVRGRRPPVQTGSAGTPAARSVLAARVEPPPPLDRVAERERCRAGLRQDPERAVVAYLAAHLRVSPAAVHGPDLAERLVRHGVESGLAHRVGAWLGQCVAARYGGPPADDAARAAAAWLDELDAALDRCR